MRDVGILVWVLFLIVGVVGSMVSSLRRAQQRALASAVQRPASSAAPPAPAPPRRAAPAAPRPLAVAQEHPHPGQLTTRRRLFANKPEIVRAVIAAEVLGKPRGLTDEYTRY
ncbi:MAG: hypothetical protein JO104_01575 [Candidatus Eremiobacteraeota bacterium]|nr:hypothetical protein [Candidatus Eremiobacteraeota bacterium]